MTVQGLDGTHCYGDGMPDQRIAGKGGEVKNSLVATKHEVSRVWEGRGVAVSRLNDAQQRDGNAELLHKICWSESSGQNVFRAKPSLNGGNGALALGIHKPSAADRHGHPPTKPRVGNDRERNAIRYTSAFPQVLNNDPTQFHARKALFRHLAISPCPASLKRRGRLLAGLSRVTRRALYRGLFANAVDSVSLGRRL